MNQSEIETKLDELTERVKLLSETLAQVLQATNGMIANYGLDVPSTVQILRQDVSLTHPSAPSRPVGFPTEVKA